METKEHQIHRDEAHRDGGDRVFGTALDRRRVLALAGAIREHEARVRRQTASPRPHDLALYRRLRQIGGQL